MPLRTSTRTHPSPRRAARPLAALLLPLLLPLAALTGCVTFSDDAPPPAPPGAPSADAVTGPTSADPAGASTGSAADRPTPGRATPTPRVLDLSPIEPVDPTAIVVVSDLDNMPFAGIDEFGLPVGRDVEMMQMLAGMLGRPLEWHLRPFDELLPLIEAGAADVACATLGITEARREHVEFSRPYFVTTLAVVVRAGEHEPKSLAELSGKKVSAGAGTTSELAVREMLAFATPVFENKSGAPTRERLLSGEIDAAVMDGPAADALVSQAPGFLMKLQEDLGSELYALAIPKGRPEFVAELNAALKRLVATGSMESLDLSYQLRSR